MRRLGASAILSSISRTAPTTMSTPAACSGISTTQRTNTTRTAARTNPTPSATAATTHTTANQHMNNRAGQDTNDCAWAVTLDAAGVWVGGGGGAMRAAVEAVLRRCCCCEEVKEHSSSTDASRRNREEIKGTTRAALEEGAVKELPEGVPPGGLPPPPPVSPMAVAMVLRAVYRDLSRPIKHHHVYARSDDDRATRNQTLTRLSEDIIYGNWERIARRFNYSLKEVPALQGYALSAEEIAAVARDVGHPLRQLVNQISYAEHGAVDVSGLYRQVQHAAYAPPVVVPDAEVAAFAQCLLQQTSAMEHALAASATTNAASEKAATNRPKRTKRPRKSDEDVDVTSEDTTAYFNEQINGEQNALLHIFNQAVRASVPTCAQWTFTDAMIAEVTVAARAMISCSHDDDDAKVTAAARRVLEALVAANGRILGTITLQGTIITPPMSSTASPACIGEVAAMVSPLDDVATPLHAANDDRGPTNGGNSGEAAQQPPLLSWFTSVPGKAARADTIYVRAVYEQIWELLLDPQQLFGWDRPGDLLRVASANLLLVGSPGIGKSWALNYLLYKAVTEERVGCPKRLVMLWGVGGLWAFLPDGRVIHGGLRGPTHQHPPTLMIEALVARYAPAPADQSGVNPTMTAATVDASSSSTAALPALLLYDLGMEEVGRVYARNMITVIATTLFEPKYKDILKHATHAEFYMPPWGEHEFKAFFKGHPDVKRALEEINKNNSISSIALEESAADALVAQEFEKYGGVLQGAFDGQQASRLQHALDEAVAEAVFAGSCYYRIFPLDTFAGVLMNVFPKKLAANASSSASYAPPFLDSRCSFSVGFRSKHIESLFEQQLERAIALVAVRREMDEMGWPREY